MQSWWPVSALPHGLPRGNVGAVQGQSSRTLRATADIVSPLSAKGTRLSPRQPGNPATRQPLEGTTPSRGLVQVGTSAPLHAIGCSGVFPRIFWEKFPVETFSCNPYRKENVCTALNAESSCRWRLPFSWNVRWKSRNSAAVVPQRKPRKVGESSVRVGQVGWRETHSQPTK